MHVCECVCMYVCMCICIYANACAMQAIRDTPRRVPFVLRTSGVRKACVYLGIPFHKNADDSDIFLQLWDSDAQKLVAFAMGLQTRLGEESDVVVLGHEGVRLVAESFWGV
jgi:hypothetical protein